MLVCLARQGDTLAGKELCGVTKVGDDRPNSGTHLRVTRPFHVP
jgi:hypothetical protein